MVVTFKTIDKIDFPVYKLSSFEWELVDGLLMLNEKILDDTNMPGETLGIRRLQTPHKPLYRLSRAVDSIVGIIKQEKRTFIDSKGRPFIYKKTMYCHLKYYKIREIERKEVASVLWLHGVSTGFTIPRPPNPRFSWAGVLHFKQDPWLLYDYAEEKLKESRRKV